MMKEMENTPLLDNIQLNVMDENQTLRIVLVGKTGSGKSSLGNTIFGEERDQGPFKTSDSPVSATNKCEAGKKDINGKNIHLIDTPGFFDTAQDTRKTKAEILKSLKECVPGPHAFLLVLKVERYTQQEQEVVKKMLKCFSEDAYKYTTVVFTHGDQLDKGTKIEDWADENENLKTLVKKCGGRVHVFDNKYWNNSQDPYRNNQYQVRELLNTIHQTVRENGGGHFTSSFWQWIKSIELTDIPLPVLVGLILGGIVLVATGAGVALAGATGAIAGGVVVAEAIAGGAVVAEVVAEGVAIGAVAGGTITAGLGGALTCTGGILGVLKQKTKKSKIQ